MFDSPVLNVIIGIVFIYLLYSLLASLLSEIIATNLGLRSRMLEKAIQRMLNDDKDQHFWAELKIRMKVSGKRILNSIQFVLPFWKKFVLEPEKTLAGKFYNQPLIKYLGANRFFPKPPYIGKENFSKNLFDMLKSMGQERIEKIDPDKTDATTLEKIQAALGVGPYREKGASKDIEPETLKYLRSLLDDAQNDLEKFRAHTEKWFDDTMQRASGWYKNHIQFILFFIGIVLAVTFNVDTVEIIKRLSKDDKARDRMVQMASDYVKSNPEVKGTNGNVSAITEPTVYTKRMDSLTKAVDSLLAKDIKNANGLVAIGWDTPVDFQTCANLNPEEKDRSKRRCLECLAVAKCKDQKSTDAVGRAQRALYIACIILRDPLKMFGFIITALAISLGAPFWFDLLKKLVQLRGSGGKPDNNSKESSHTAVVPNVKRVG